LPRRHKSALHRRADAVALLDALKSTGVPMVEIGEVRPPAKPLIQVV